MITARKNQLRNQAKEQESPDRAKPKAKSELQPTSNVENPAVEDGENPEENHPPKGKGEGHRITRSLKRNIKKEMATKHPKTKTKTPHMTPKRMRTEPEPIGEKQQEDI